MTDNFLGSRRSSSSLFISMDSVGSDYVVYDVCVSVFFSMLWIISHKAKTDSNEMSPATQMRCARFLFVDNLHILR